MTSAKIVFSGAHNSTIREISIRDKRLITPSYFPSITSTETRTRTASLIDIITSNAYPRLLVSAYDLYGLKNKQLEETIDKLDRFSDDGNFLLLDSGGFEKAHYPHGDWSFVKYEKIIQQTNSDLYASFDTIPYAYVPYEKILNELKTTAKKSKALMRNNQCMIICHANGQNTEKLCNLIEELGKDDKELLNMIAVAERECGDKLEDQCQTIKQVRETVNRFNVNGIIHVLGCGNPVSMTALAFSGADTFDSVDWCRWTIDNSTLQYRNLSHVSFLNCSCFACNGTLSGKERVWLHNLALYQNFMYRLQESIRDNWTLSEFLLKERVDKRIVSFLSHNIFK